MKPTTLTTRVLSMVLCLSLLVSLCSCNAPPVDTTAPTATAPKAPAVDYGTTTLMIYMIGSDLECDTGAASKDLEEIIAAKADLSSTNVVVCAGGTIKWYNETADKDRLTTMHLTKDGFVVDHTQDPVSMVEPTPLSEFLTYSYTQYPADRYALIMWDHGMGPAIGYGKDMLFDGDSLSLAEMRTAMEASPFGTDNKLSFVGFDACLMASAELACVWDDYARYLIASQEVEPYFGWDYAFLSELHKRDTADLASVICSKYLTACEDYYAKKKYSGRDTTLSCVDLSKTAALETALNGLFTAAENDMQTNYISMAKSRVNTRAFGRASTGSEYDLIDIADLAAQYWGLYPGQAAALQTAVSDMVVTNATNADSACGLSLYYPFFNKTYYESQWSAAYAELNVLDGYQAYLQTYETYWLKEDMLSDAKSVAPTVEDGQFSMTLPQEQADNVVSSKFYVFAQPGEDIYQPLFMSGNITRNGNTFTTDFDGKMLFIKDHDGTHRYPFLLQYDTVSNVTRYAVVTYLSTYDDAHNPDLAEQKYITALYQLAVDTKTDAVSVSSLTPYSSESLGIGKTEELDINDYYTLEFPQHASYYATYYDNGTVKPFSEWTVHGAYTADILYAADDWCFEMAPLPKGRYYFMYELTDAQGNVYSSELVPFETNGVAPKPTAPAPIITSWNEGDSTVIYDKQNVCVSLVKQLTYDGEKFMLQIANRNDFPVVVSADDLMVNSNIRCDTSVLSSCTVPAGATVLDVRGISFGEGEAFVNVNDLSALSFTLSLRNDKTGRTMLRHQLLTVNLTDETKLHDYQSYATSFASDCTYPVYGGYADEQVLYDEDGVSVTLIRMAGSSSQADYGNIFLKYQNLSDTDVWINPLGVVIGDIYVPVSAQKVHVPAGVCIFSEASTDSLSVYGITSVSDLSLYLGFWHNDSFIGGFEKAVTCPVTLSQAGATVPVLNEGETVLLDEHGVKLTLLGKDIDDVTGSTTWTLCLVNESGHDITLQSATQYVDGVEQPRFDYALVVWCEGVGNGQRTVMTITAYGHTVPADAATLSVRLRMLDIAKETIYATFDTMLNFPANPTL